MDAADEERVKKMRECAERVDQLGPLVKAKKKAVEDFSVSRDETLKLENAITERRVIHIKMYAEVEALEAFLTRNQDWAGKIKIARDGIQKDALKQEVEAMLTSIGRNIDVI